MGRLLIAAIAAAGLIWKTDPVLKPVIDGMMFALIIGLMFWMGDMFSEWLYRWEAKPHWRKVRRPRRPRPRHTHQHHSGASMPLLER